MTSSVTSSSSSNPYDIINGTTSSSGTSSGTNSAQQIQDQFLKLLTTQLQAQDPLNPMDNSQMTSQMAQISQVSGLEKLNTSMQALIQSQAANQSMMAASTIGRQALVAGNQLALSSGSAQGAVMLSGAADKLTINIKNANGVVVDTLTVNKASAGMNSFSWDGKDASGQTLADGNYTFEAQATGGTSSGSSAVTATPFNNQKISAVAWDQGTPQLVFTNGSRAALSDVAQLS